MGDYTSLIMGMVFFPSSLLVYWHTDLHAHQGEAQ
jgi:hypothetical protein